MQSFVIPAAATVLRINNQTYGAVNSFQWNSNVSYRAVNGIDQLEAQELIPASVSVSGSVGLYRITNSGGLEGIGVTTTFDNLSALKYFVLQLVDLRVDKILFECRNCVVEGQSWGVSAKGLMTGSLNFKGINWSGQ